MIQKHFSKLRKSYTGPIFNQTLENSDFTETNEYNIWGRFFPE
jgi:hypothetical protein